MHGYPGLFAPASLKHDELVDLEYSVPSYPGLFAPASLKQFAGRQEFGVLDSLSGAFRSGLIEAPARPSRRCGPPRLSGAFRSGLIEAIIAGEAHHRHDQLSGAFRSGLIEAAMLRFATLCSGMLSGAFRSGLIEANAHIFTSSHRRGYPGLFAPASLKHVNRYRLM